MFDLQMMFYGALIGIVVAIIAVRIGLSLGNSFYDVVDQHIKSRLAKK
jgi:hypothetical protein